jgi:hypothetical protein
VTSGHRTEEPPKRHSRMVLAGIQKGSEPIRNV